MLLKIPPWTETPPPAPPPPRPPGVPLPAWGHQPAWGSSPEAALQVTESRLLSFWQIHPGTRMQAVGTVLSFLAHERNA